ncbi:thioredoxin reductase [Mycobacterium intermedium]|uniref:Thioredoxin reductase n=1 Tax=Mycobacterium intermedium TaxID=28445 RepID=A0A1E3S612_MYCIE|nr:FAD-dependent oxidoreductase [Mycobacterium intermedium]MCV6966465.1 FAD-dependent oxidoreductase [Mycobacterium intermedium]ODQ97579.1 thioredoxin reductase [Mycobacterium intermedium]OPE49683.1 thioredoxin reductase [Mycobacterium intermedium]ORB00694.1 thioredoxin reductase [Mycobacterium intermedium]
MRIRDVIVVGSGPAGYTAAIFAARAGLDTLVIEGHEPGGALLVAGQVDNYPGVVPFVTGPVLVDQMRWQADYFGAELHSGHADGFVLGPQVKTVNVGANQHHGRALILAMGSVNRTLNVEGESKLTGHGVSTSAKRDGARFAGCDVAVIGGGEAAVEEALYLAGIARHVTLIHYRPRLRPSTIAVTRLCGQPNVTVLTSTEVLAVHGDRYVTGLRIRDTRRGVDSTIAVAAAFVAIGQAPRSDPLIGLVDLDASGHVVTAGTTTQTSAEGVFAAGDLIDRRYRQAVTAAASGCAAARDAERWLNQSAGPLTASTIQKERSAS